MKEKNELTSHEQSTNDVNETNGTNEININRKYKDILFRYILADRKVLLNLYNALNDTDYNDENDLTINTLEDAIYLGHKNDMSFLIGGTMTHCSTTYYVIISSKVSIMRKLSIWLLMNVSDKIFSTTFC